MSDPKMGMNNKPSDQLNLEEIVHITNKIGMEYVDAKQRLDHLILMKPSRKAQISLRLESSQKLTESKLQRLTETDPEYVSYLNSIAEAKKQAEKLRVRYDSYKNLFEAKRSMLSYQKAEMSLL